MAKMRMFFSGYNDGNSDACPERVLNSPSVMMSYFWILKDSSFRRRWARHVGIREGVDDANTE